MSPMNAVSFDSEPFWLATSPETDFRPFSGDLTVDVAVIGGGITGLTAAALLKAGGRDVAVIEARRVGRQATGRSTAKVTSQHGIFYTQLFKSRGRGGARIYAAANQSAVECVADFVQNFEIDCDFERKSAYVFTRSDDQVRLIENEAEIARSIDLPADVVRDAPLPFPIKAALRFTNQVQIHPCKYLVGLARQIDGEGSHVFEATRVSRVETGSLLCVVTDHGLISARNVIVATHLPITGQGLFFAKAYPYSEPVLAAPIERASAPDGMFISADTPHLSVICTENDGRPYLIAAGGHHKPGQPAEAKQALADLEENARTLFDLPDIERRWTNQDYWPMDLVPFVGSPASGDKHLHIATGFRAWGLSNGTAAGMILADTVAGKTNPWAKLFDAARLKPVASAPMFLKENTRVAGRLARGYLKRRSSSPRKLERGDAGIFKMHGERIAVYCDDAGSLHLVSAVCTHMGCVVGWNPTERTWDCPCHGSRFAIDGAVIEGPAVSPLAPSRSPDR